MNKYFKAFLILCLALLAAVGVTRTLTAQTGGTFDLSWSSLDNGGGGVSAGGDFALSDTVAQPASSSHSEMTGGDFALTSGFWSRRLDPALEVTLDSFTADSVESGILLRWVTVSEVDNLGFNLYRAPAPDSAPARMNDELIPSQAPGGGGADYEYLDEMVAVGETWFYWLEGVDLNGGTNRYGPVSATFADPSALTLAGMDVATPSYGVTLAVLSLLALAGLGATWIRVRSKWQRESKEQRAKNRGSSNARLLDP